MPKKRGGIIGAGRAAYHFLLQVWQGFVGDRGLLAASSIAFYLTLSMIPFTLLLISLSTFFISEAQARGFVTALSRSLGGVVSGALQSEVFAIVSHRDALTGVSLLLGLWAGSQIFLVIEEALNQVWHVQEQRPFWVRRGLALLMVLITGVLFGLAIGLNFLVDIINRLPNVHAELLRRHWLIFILLRFVIPFVLVSIVFILTYSLLSTRHMGVRLVWPGAVAAGFVWLLTLQIFSWYADNIAHFSLVYGSLGGLVLLMLWFNYSAMIMLLGAEVASVIHQRRIDAGRPDPAWGTPGQAT